ncbi:MAG: hypothetical protein H6550_09465 [Chitinophagales bacterium]|nr:hypothetical protein [Chitinophagales bacterium]
MSIICLSACGDGRNYYSCSCKNSATGEAISGNYRVYAQDKLAESECAKLHVQAESDAGLGPNEAECTYKP